MGRFEPMSPIARTPRRACRLLMSTRAGSIFPTPTTDASDGNTTTVNATQTGSESSEPSQRPFVVTSVVPRSNDTTTTATSINSTQAATSVTVMFNSTQAGATARLCYQFRNETWVLYTAETTKVSELTSYAASGGGDGRHRRRERRQNVAVRRRAPRGRRHCALGQGTRRRRPARGRLGTLRLQPHLRRSQRRTTTVTTRQTAKTAAG